MTRTHLILDGLQDPALGRELSATWMAAGFVNGVDVAGQCGWIDAEPPLNEGQFNRAASVARRVGIELRATAGETYKPDNDLNALRQRLAYEYKSRFATALVFGLPALGVHYFGRILAGGGDDARSMLYPWLFEALLVGWAVLAAGWPILWQGGLSLRFVRGTADLLTLCIAGAAYVSSLAGLLVLLVTGETWMKAPTFHAALGAVALATLQRWLAHRSAARLAGRAMLMMPRYGKLIGAWLVVTLLLMLFGPSRMGVAFALLLPPMISLGAVNRTSPGWSMALPVFGFAGLMVLGPRSLGLDARGMEIEIALVFQLIVVGMMAWGWRKDR